MGNRYTRATITPEDMEQARRDIAKRIGRYRSYKELQLEDPPPALQEAAATIPPPDPGMISLAELAEMAGKTHRAVSGHRIQGRIHAVERKPPGQRRAWYVTPEEAQRYLAWWETRHPRKRPSRT